jgi:hypothetical protein
VKNESDLIGLLTWDLVLCGPLLKWDGDVWSVIRVEGLDQEAYDPGEVVPVDINTRGIKISLFNSSRI